MKHIFLFLSILFAVQIGQSQETWNACNSTVNVIPAPSYDSTFVLSAPSRAALAKGMANWTPSTSGGASYLVYTALLTQSGSGAPTAIVLQNTLGGTVVWTRDDQGVYYGTLSGAFTENKTWTYPYSQTSVDNFKLFWANTNEVQFTTYSTDSQLTLTPVEIRVYP